jgi:hypothetical protein
MCVEIAYYVLIYQEVLNFFLCVYNEKQQIPHCWTNQISKPKAWYEGEYQKHKDGK